MISRMLKETMVVVADMFNIKLTHSVLSHVCKHNEYVLVLTPRSTIYFMRQLCI